MSDRAQRLAIVLDMAADKEKSAAEAFKMARDLWQSDQNRLQELQGYFDDYQGAIGSSAFSRAWEMARQREFLQQLGQALDQQVQVVEQRLKVVEDKKALWQQANLKHKALRDFVERIKSDERNTLSRQEAKQLDEWCTQAFHQTRTSENQWC